ncbi:hypothetical protein D6B98_21935 [Bradyrhizobium sp. LVM 105]|nr:hypothetical protein D6B98_21935 [Bradyrhizobium sp. LVM 105]
MAARGYLAATRSFGRSKIIRELDPTAEETLFFPGRAGGAASIITLERTLILIQERIRRHRGTPRPAFDAEALLKNWLTSDQLTQFEATRTFVVVGCSGARYRISARPVPNVVSLDKLGDIEITPLTGAKIRSELSMLIWKIVLETGKPELLKGMQKSSGPIADCVPVLFPPA